MSARPFSIATFREVAAAVLVDDAVELLTRPHHGDNELNPNYPWPEPRAPLKDAAVLVPVVAREPEATVILTVRTADLRSHAGQIAFPGGKIDGTDASPAAAALREADEEIGLDPAFVDTLGYLPVYQTGSGFRIYPVIGVVDPRFGLTPNPHEVADVFEVPLGFLMDPDNHRLASREAALGTRFFYEMPYGDRYIWGVTAGIIRRMWERLYGSWRA
jgi:8-oxo-dGTP pyrophosphatase MutT (NUDIX family)